MISKQITLGDCVSRAKMQLGLASTSDNDIWFETLADEAAKHLQCLSIYVKKQCNVEIENGKFKLPCGFGRFIGMRFCDSDNGAFLEGIYADLKFLTLDCGCSGEEVRYGIIYVRIMLTRIPKRSQVAQRRNTMRHGNHKRHGSKAKTQKIISSRLRSR
jgi:hypothetical protein